MKSIIKLAVICLMPMLMVGCSTVTTEQSQKQMDDLNMYMLSHGQPSPTYH